jgi:hypothetical protein
VGDYFRPGDRLSLGETGELVIVTRASREGIHIRSRPRPDVQFGPERFLPTQYEMTWYGGDDD